ncbi:MAG: cytochrome P450 [Sulfitobacter sp.]
MTDLPPKPADRPEKVSLWRYVQLFRQDILSAQPARLYGAWMAEFRTPFFRSYLVNQPDLVQTLLKDRPGDFPKSDRISEGLRPLLGNSVFLTNGDTWQRQRRIIDPAFEGGRLRQTFPAIWDASEAMAKRLHDAPPEPVQVEKLTSHAAADVIFRMLFSIPIDNEVAGAVFAEFQAYQRSQPILNIAAFVPLPRWMPRPFRKSTRASARKIRGLLAQLTHARMAEITAGTAPDDLATKIMTTVDPVTGKTFSTSEMIDQVAIFFLAGHETSASALAWSLYLLARYPDWQDRVASEARAVQSCDLAVMSRLKISRDVFRETLRLYPPVPMMVRQSTKSQVFRDRKIPVGAQLVLSPWHLHRHTRLWDNPDGFDPGRWHTDNGKTCQRTAYIPFSAGPRVCPGAGVAMVEGPLILSRILRDFKVEIADPEPPVPVAHLTVRSRNGIWLRFVRR